MVERLHTHGLEELSSAVRYREYLLELISPHCGRRILEVGAGLGDFAVQIGGGRTLIATDTDAECVESLRQRFAGSPNVDVQYLDILNPGEVGVPADSVVAINVLEHIEDDVTALKNMGQLLSPQGRVVLFVPAYPALYGPFDKAVGHVRRYTPRTLRDSVEKAGLTVQELRPVNFIGGIGWWFAVRLAKGTRPRPSLIKIYDRVLVPIVRFIERRFRPPFGQSLLCVAGFPPTASTGALER